MSTERFLATADNASMKLTQTTKVTTRTGLAVDEGVKVVVVVQLKCGNGIVNAQCFDIDVLWADSLSKGGFRSHSQK